MRQTVPVCSHTAILGSLSGRSVRTDPEQDRVRSRRSLPSSPVLFQGLSPNTQVPEQAWPLLLTHTVVADAAVRGTGRTEDLTCVAILQLHYLVVDLEVFNPRGWALTLRHGPVGGL